MLEDGRGSGVGRVVFYGPTVGGLPPARVVACAGVHCESGTHVLVRRAEAVTCRRSKKCFDLQNSDRKNYDRKCRHSVEGNY